MWHLEIWFRGGRGGTGWMVGLGGLEGLIFKGGMQNILEKSSQELKSVILSVYKITVLGDLGFMEHL